MGTLIFSALAVVIVCTWAGAKIIQAALRTSVKPSEDMPTARVANPNGAEAVYVKVAESVPHVAHGISRLLLLALGIGIAAAPWIVGVMLFGPAYN